MTFAFSEPPISVFTAHAFTAFFACSYVGSLYLSKNARLKFAKEASPGATDGEEREKLTKLKKELSQTCLEFSVSIHINVGDL